jgi:nitroimidazol reductase NimA-like FMN-containing flavoprotein (pyridoxamine 5'-phosphate oxidase superfamily)
VRRKEREITDRAAMEAIIQETEVCRMGLCDGGRRQSRKSRKRRLSG